MTASALPNFGLVEGWAAAEDGWDQDMANNLRGLDAWIHPSVQTIQDAPPVGPSEGDRYIVGTGSGAWATHDGELAVWQRGAWAFTVPQRGCAVHREDQGRDIRWTGTAWIVASSFINAAEFASLQDAIDATPEGETLYLGGGSQMLPSPTGLLVTKSITIDGAAPPYIFENIGPPKLPAATGTILRFYNASPTDPDGAQDSNGIVIQNPPAVGGIVPKVTNVTIRNLGIENHLGQPTTKGTGVGITIDATLGYIGNVRIENTTVLFAGYRGYDFLGTDLGGCCVDQSEFVKNSAAGCMDDGFHAHFSVDVDFVKCLAVGNRMCGFYLHSCAAAKLDHCLSNDNGADFDDSTWPFWHQAQYYLQGCLKFRITDCDLEEWGDKSVPHGIFLESCHGGEIGGCGTYTNMEYPASPVHEICMIFLCDTTGVIILPNTVSGCTNYVYAMSSRNVSGNVVFQPAVLDWRETGNIAPNLINVDNQLDTTTDRTGGNLVLMPLTTAEDYDTARGCQFIAAIQLPQISSLSAFTQTPKAGTFLLAWRNGALLPHWYDGTHWFYMTGTQV